MQSIGKLTHTSVAAVLTLSLFVGIVPSAGAQTVVATVPVGRQPVAVAVNHNTHRVYVVNRGDNSVTVIDGSNDSVLATVPVGNGPLAVVVDPGLDRAFVLNESSNTVTVLDGATNTVAATISVGSQPLALAVNPNTHRVYVANNGGNSLSVIDGASNTVLATVPVGKWPWGVVVDPGLDKVFVINHGTNNATIIDGVTNAVLATVPTGNAPDHIAIDPATHRVYTTNSGSIGHSVTVIDAATHAATPLANIPVGNGIAINPTTHKVYVLSMPGTWSGVTVLDGTSLAVLASLPTGNVNSGITIDPATNRIYVSNMYNNSVTVIDGSADTVVATLAVGNQPEGSALDPATHKVYVANNASDSVSVIAEERRRGGSVAVPLEPVLMRPDLAITKRLLGAAVSGQPVKYLVTVTNVGTAAMPGPVTVTDTLGTGLTYVSAAGTGWTCTASGQTVTCTHPGPVPAGGVLPAITVTAQSDGTTEGVTNCAAVKGAKDAADVPLDQNNGNDRFCVETPLQQPAPPPDLAIAKKATGPLVAGQQGSYQITVSNVGTAAAQGPIVVTDALGTGLTYVSAAGTGWTCTASGQTVTCTHPGPVPAGGGLPPITLTVQVAADAKEVKNCARVKAVEQPASLGMPEVALPDANPANNEACDVSPVGPAEGKPGRICGVKFLDHDGDGTWDANEPGLPNWTIQVKDAAGNPVGSAVTGPKGRFCIEVKPGTYSVAEVVKPGWVQTAPAPAPPGTATVTVVSGQTVTVAFGNRPEKEPCCLSFTWLGGKADQFSTADGATAEPAVPPPGQPLAYFDQTQADQWFRHRFILPEGQCLREAKLELLVRPLHRMPVGVSSSRNDTIALYAGSGVWGAKFGPSGPAAVTNQLSTSEWVLDNWPGGMTLTLDLASLPGGGNLLASLDAARTLDIVVQDDTSVDYARLVVRFCDCAEEEKEALGAAARGGAREIILPLRKVCNPKDDDCNGWVEKAGAPHDASVSIVRNIPGRRIMLADGAPRSLDAPPVIRGGRTFLPVRALAEALGLGVAWDANEKKVTLTGDERVVALWVGKPKAAIREGGRTVGAGQITEIIKRTQGPGSEGGNTAPDPNRIITIEGTKDPCLPRNPGDPYPGGPLCDPPSLIEIDQANPDVVPFIENGRVMLPLRFIAEALELDVSFEPQTQQVTIKRPSSVCTRRDKNGNCVQWVKLYDYP